MQKILKRAVTGVATETRAAQSIQNLESKDMRAYLQNNLGFIKADDLSHEKNDNPEIIAQTFKKYGCCVIRGLNKEYLPKVMHDINVFAKQSLSLLDSAIDVCVSVLLFFLFVCFQV